MPRRVKANFFHHEFGAVQDRYHDGQKANTDHFQEGTYDDKKKGYDGAPAIRTIQELPKSEEEGNHARFNCTKGCLKSGGGFGACMGKENFTRKRPRLSLPMKPISSLPVASKVMTPGKGREEE
jgi:hypothetical protein